MQSVMFAEMGEILNLVEVVDIGSRSKCLIGQGLCGVFELLESQWIVFNDGKVF